MKLNQVTIVSDETKICEMRKLLEEARSDIMSMFHYGDSFDMWEYFDNWLDEVSASLAYALALYYKDDTFSSESCEGLNHHIEAAISGIAITRRTVHAHDTVAMIWHDATFALMPIESAIACL